MKFTFIKETIKRIVRVPFFHKSLVTVTTTAGLIDIGGSFAVAFNKSIPAKTRFIAGGRGVCCSGALVTAYGANIARRLNNPALEQTFQYCCLGFTGFYIRAEGATETALAITYFATNITSTYLK